MTHRSPFQPLPFCDSVITFTIKQVCFICLNLFSLSFQPYIILLINREAFQRHFFPHMHAYKRWLLVIIFFGKLNKLIIMRLLMHDMFSNLLIVLY